MSSQRISEWLQISGLNNNSKRSSTADQVTQQPYNSAKKNISVFSSLIAEGIKESACLFVYLWEARGH